MELTRRHEYAEARKLLEGVAEPQSAPARIAFHRLRAAIASGLGDAKAAMEEMRAALKLAPDDPALSLAAAAAELQAGALDAALEHARAAGATAPALALAGDIHDRRGEYVEAARAYQQAVAKDLASERYRVALALELVQHHTFEPAVDVLTAAAPLFPRSARIRVLLGVAHYALGHSDAAAAALRDALAIEPSLEPAYRYLAQIALESAEAPAASTVDVLCRWNRVVCGAVQSRAAEASGDAQALNAAISVLRQAPEDDRIARCELGRAYQASGHLDQARQALERCVALDPSPQNHYRLGLLYGRLGLQKEAKEQMELRRAAAQKLSEDVARRENLVQAFQVLAK